MAEKKKTSQVSQSGKSLSDNLKELAEISAWFSDQNDLDIESGLEKVKTAAALIKSSKEKLDKLENEFKEIEKDFSDNSDNSAR
jgi:translation elongation factor EF-1beta